jgi:hypothetical protein
MYGSAEGRVKEKTAGFSIASMTYEAISTPGASEKRVRK